CGSCIDQTYCDAHSTSSVTEWIERVMVNGQELISGNDGGYGDHTDVSFTLNTDAGQQLELTPGYSGPAYSEWWSVWIDQDQDGQFTDAERVFQSAAGSTTMVASNAVAVQYFSGSTRLRIAMRYGGNATDACTGFENGEVEDFCVQMEPTGVAEATLPRLNLQPTLADDHIDIIVDRFVSGVMMQLAIIDVGGRVVRQAALRNSRNTIATEDLAAGHYRCVLRSGDAVIATGRFVVVH
ncbi:MAG TPA: GEVED domain-containing protein, partial [Flavobacteriales bacterium]|nr:GEVED domain-containing protein [Flavobacteriales bacterium]